MSKDNKNVGSITKYWEYEVLHPNIIVYTGESLTAILVYDGEFGYEFEPELKYGIKILDSNDNNITIKSGITSINIVISPIQSILSLSN